MASPLSQFEIKKLIPLEFMGFDISFTNSSLAMLTTVVLIILGEILLNNKDEFLIDLSVKPEII